MASTQSEKATQNGGLRITKSYIESLKAPSTQQRLIRDAELKGFGVRITPGGAKSFILEKRINGKVRRQTIGRYPEMTVEAARKQALVLLGQIAQGINPIAEKEREEKQGTTMREAFEDFKKVRKSLKPYTLYNYGRFLDTAFPDWRDRPLIAISKDMVARRHTRLGDDHGPAYANHALRFLRALFNFAIAQYEDEEGRPLVPDNPVKRISNTRAWYRVERRRTVIKRHQLPAWLGAVKALKATAQADAVIDLNQPEAIVADFLYLLLFTGLRRQEAATLRWDQVDLLDRSLTLPDPKNREPLTLPLSDFVQSLLEARHAQRVNEYVFPGTGQHGYLVEPRRPIQRVKDWSEVDFTLHDLRRTFITVAESLDIPPYAIKRLVNHKMHNDVTAGYIVSDVERLRGPAQKISDYILEAGGIPLPTEGEM